MSPRAGGAEPTAHQPVLLESVLELLSPDPGATILDCTLGAGGHAAALLEAANPGGSLLGIDRDPHALELARERLPVDPEGIRLRHGRFEEILTELATRGERFHVILLDLGVSSLQLDRAERGFSIRRDGPLDMRMDPSGGATAADLLAREPEDRLVWILEHWGEERWARRLAARLVAVRKQAPLETTAELAALVAGTIPRRFWPRRIHPATRTFQALRIAVNRELVELEEALEEALGLLRPGGRLGVIAFHSLEDRIAKQVLRRWTSACICPPELPVCRCEGRPRAHRLGRQPIRPGEMELASNPRSRSARFRAVQREVAS